MNANKVMVAVGIFLIVLCFQAAPSYGVVFGVVDPPDGGTTVNGDSTDLDQVCPCTEGSYKNHGEYVSACAQAVKVLYNAGEITKEEGSALISEAAKSDCCRGKK